MAFDLPVWNAVFAVRLSQTFHSACARKRSHVEEDEAHQIGGDARIPGGVVHLALGALEAKGARQQSVFAFLQMCPVVAASTDLRRGQLSQRRGTHSQGL